MSIAAIRDAIRDVPDFPKKGIVFKDITPVLLDPAAFRAAVDALAARYAGMDVDVLVAVESRGFVFGAALAYKLGKGLAIVRKPGKLPWRTLSQTYSLEYGTDTIQMHEDAVRPGQRVVVVDDLLATGGTARAVADLVEKLGGTVVECAFVIELSFLKGREKLGAGRVFSLVSY